MDPLSIVVRMFPLHSALRYSLGRAYRKIVELGDKVFISHTELSLVKDIKSIAEQEQWCYQTRLPASMQMRIPSKGIPDNTLLLVRNGRKLAHEQIGSIMLGDRSIGEKIYSQLYSVVRYPIPETFVCDIPNVYISAPNGVVSTSDYRILEQSAVRYIARQVPNTGLVSFKGDTLQGTFVSLLGWSAQNYSHWFMDLLPRLSVLGTIDPSVRFLLSAPAQNFQFDSLRSLGVKATQIHVLEPGWHRLEHLLLCYASGRSSICREEHLYDIRDRIVHKVVGSERRTTPYRRIYVSRSKARRRLVNENELVPILRYYGFQVINCEDLSFSDQVRLFADAKYILGPHGSGIINHMFCPAGAYTIEIYNPIWLNHCFCITANMLGHEHWHVIGENVGRECDTYLSPAKLSKLLAYIFSEGKIVEEDY